MELRRFECITCGGDLVEKNGRYVCESCGNAYEAVEKISEAEVIALNQATALRKLWRFDDAWDRYDLILKDYPQSESASWGALLCEYGIIYETDYDGSRKINCHRLSEKPVYENAYYANLSAEHKTEAGKIEDLRLAILAKSKKIEPYDVFICYKQTEEKFGRTFPTREATWARDIYEILTHKMGLRVFFAEKALMNENTEWEPHIYAALNSAKLMFVLASSEENVNAVWVKNEWKRFHRYIKEGKDKVIRVVYDNMEAYKLPKELQDTQAIDHNGMWENAVKKAAEFLCDKPAQKSAMELQMEALLAELEALKRGQGVKEPEISAEEAYKIGNDYCYGRNGKPQDYAEAVKWFRLAAEQGDLSARNNLKNIEEKIEESKMTPEESYKRGNDYYDGINGRPLDYKKAVVWYRKAAEQGNVKAQNNLGFCYERGHGVPRDFIQSAGWFMKAATQGHVSAQYNLGVCYTKGQGVEQDKLEAVKWYREAAKQGH